VPAVDNFRENVRRALSLKGWTQEKLADESGVHFVTISRILCGKIEPSITVCEKISVALALPFEKFFANPV